MFKLNFFIALIVTAGLSTGAFAQEKHLKGPYPGIHIGQPAKNIFAL
jgi:hypothetical protein